MVCFWFLFKMSGRLHRVEYKLYSRSPLSEPELVTGLVTEFQLTGRFTGEERFLILSFSPLYAQGLPYFDRFKMSGRFTGEENILSTLVLPSLNRNTHFYVPHFNPHFKCIFVSHIFVMTIGYGVVYTVTGGLYYVYI